MSCSKAPTTTAADAKLFQTILMNLEHKPSVDWNFIAKACGYKDAKYAQERLRLARIRFNARDYIDGKKSRATPPKTKLKREISDMEVTPSPSPKVMKLGKGTSSTAQKRSSLGPKVFHTTWTPTNGSELKNHPQRKASIPFGGQGYGRDNTEDDLAETGVSVLDFGKKSFTPQDTNDEDSYVDEENSAQDYDEEESDLESECSEI
ncbi:hypothetical protein IFR05_016388 [Cadophora sp. M221]|nr:hypothetical protein IFR05_016388 [Cadophora sp. M221]